LLSGGSAKFLTSRKRGVFGNNDGDRFRHLAFKNKWGIDLEYEDRFLEVELDKRSIDQRFPVFDFVRSLREWLQEIDMMAFLKSMPNYPFTELLNQLEEAKKLIQIFYCWNGIIKAMAHHLHKKEDLKNPLEFNFSKESWLELRKFAKSLFESRKLPHELEDSMIINIVGLVMLFPGQEEIVRSFAAIFFEEKITNSMNDGEKLVYIFKKFISEQNRRFIIELLQKNFDIQNLEGLSDLAQTLNEMVENGACEVIEFYDSIPNNTQTNRGHAHYLKILFSHEHERSSFVEYIQELLIKETIEDREGILNIINEIPHLELATAMGHRTLNMLQRYTHLDVKVTKKLSKNISEQILQGVST
jgi:hypothetical protein